MNEKKKKGPHTKTDKLRGGLPGGPYKLGLESNHAGGSKHKNSQLNMSQVG